MALLFRIPFLVSPLALIDFGAGHLFSVTGVQGLDSADIKPPAGVLKSPRRRVRTFLTRMISSLSGRSPMPMALLRPEPISMAQNESCSALRRG